MTCQICSFESIQQILDLDEQPPCDFLTEEQFPNERFYPLSLWLCPRCKLLQVGDIVSPEVLFTPKVGYHHLTAQSKTFEAHLAALAVSVAERFSLGKEDRVVEIGSNDGALLSCFRDCCKSTLLGIDPTDVADIARKNGIETLSEFFNRDVAKRVVSSHGRAKVILALNTFAHMDNIDSVVQGIRDLLTQHGVFISENHYGKDLIDGRQYDFIYHEHYRFYLVATLKHLFERNSMRLVHVEWVDTHSGSIRVFACRKDAAFSQGSSVAQFLEDEWSLYALRGYKDFQADVERHRQEFPEMIRGLRSEGATIDGLTFPARAVTLLTSCGLGREEIRCITEMSTLKIGKFSPGGHIPVVNQEILFGEDQPDYGIILSWHLQEELIRAFRGRGFRGKFIVPLPEVKVIE